MIDDHASLNQQLNTDSTEERYLEFMVGQDCFAIPLIDVREVISVPETTPIPKAPAHFVGIMNLRGQVISVVDLRKKLSITPNKENSEEAVIIIHIGDLNIGVIVDSIDRVVPIASSAIGNVADLSTQTKSEYIQGVYRKDEGLTLIVDMPKILNVEDLTHVAKAA